MTDPNSDTRVFEGGAMMRINPSEVRPIAEQDVTKTAAELWMNGFRGENLSRKLVETTGVTPAIAGYVARSVEATIRPVALEAGKRKMVKGMAIAAAGVVLTMITYAAASAGALRGVYVVFWGLVAWGGFVFLQGLAQYSGARN